MPSWHELTCWGTVVVVVAPPLTVVPVAARALVVGLAAAAVVVPVCAGRTMEIGLASMDRLASAFFVVVVGFTVVADVGFVVVVPFGLAPTVVVVAVAGAALHGSVVTTCRNRH